MSEGPLFIRTTASVEAPSLGATSTLVPFRLLEPDVQYESRYVGPPALLSMISSLVGPRSCAYTPIGIKSMLAISAKIIAVFNGMLSPFPPSHRGYRSPCRWPVQA